MLKFIQGLLSVDEQELERDAEKTVLPVSASIPHTDIPNTSATCAGPTTHPSSVNVESESVTQDASYPLAQTVELEPDEYHEPGGVPIFRPTMQEFSDFASFIHKIERFGRKAGIVKIIPPKEWSDSLTPAHSLLSSFKIKSPILQPISGAGLPAGAYRALNVESRRSFPVSEWFHMCMSDEKREPQYDHQGELRMAKLSKKRKWSSEQKESTIETEQPDGCRRKPNEEETLALMEMYCKTSSYPREYCEALETFYWKNIAYTPAMYGADLLGSVFELTKQGGAWNLNELDNLLKKIPEAVPGVNVPYLYFGMWKATFAWHLEDMDLFSINYIHVGAPKQWYVVPPEYATRFERFAAGLFTQEFNTCSQFLRHKHCIISPRLLKAHSIPVHRMVQREGEFIITFPHGYHSGYNLGFNCAESVNFATDAWIELGKKAKFCQCVDHSVHVNVADLLDPSAAPPVEVKQPPKKTRPARTAQCALCVKTEGDLMATDVPDKVAHEICAAHIPETWIEQNDDGTSVIKGIETISVDRWRLKCDVCRRKSPSLVKRGACIQCTKGKCVKSYHVTCAQEQVEYPLLIIRLEMFMQLDPQGRLECYCPQHNPAAVEMKKKKKMQEHVLRGAQLRPGDQVIAKSVGGITFEGTIESTHPEQQWQFCRKLNPNSLV